MQNELQCPPNTSSWTAVTENLRPLPVHSQYAQMVQNPQMPRYPSGHPGLPPMTHYGRMHLPLMSQQSLSPSCSDPESERSRAVVSPSNLSSYTGEREGGSCNIYVGLTGEVGRACSSVVEDLTRNKKVAGLGLSGLRKHGGKPSPRGSCLLNL